MNNYNTIYLNMSVDIKTLKNHGYAKYRANDYETIKKNAKEEVRHIFKNNEISLKVTPHLIITRHEAKPQPLVASYDVKATWIVINEELYLYEYTIYNPEGVSLCITDFCMSEHDTEGGIA